MKNIALILMIVSVLAFGVVQAQTETTTQTTTTDTTVYETTQPAQPVLNESPFSLYLGGLVTIPSTPANFNDNYKTGWHGMLGIGISAGTNVQLIPKVEYHKFSYDFSNAPAGLSKGARSIWMFGGDAKFAIAQPYAQVKPFLLAGVGVANLKYERFNGPIDAIENISLPNDASKFYWNLGGGLDFNASEHVGLFAQARYVGIDTPGKATGIVPITVGLRIF